MPVPHEQLVDGRGAVGEGVGLERRAQRSVFGYRGPVACSPKNGSEIRPSTDANMWQIT